MTDFRTRDSFVIRLYSGGQGASLALARGSIEHLQSHTTLRFSQLEEVLQFMESRLGARLDPSQDGDSEDARDDSGSPDIL